MGIRNLQFPHILVTSDEKRLTRLQVVFMVKNIVFRVTGHLRALCTVPHQPRPAGAMRRGASDALHPGWGCGTGPGWEPCPAALGEPPVLQQLETAGQVDQDQLLSMPSTITALRMEVGPSKSRQAHTF